MSRVAARVLRRMASALLICLLPVSVVAGCSSGREAGAAGGTPSGVARSSSATTGASTTDGPTTDGPTTDGPTTRVGQRCGPPDAPAQQVTWRTDAGDRLHGVVVGHGPVVAVFAHQTDGDGLCGFWAYANWLEQRGIRSVLVDLCGYGRSDCKPGGRLDLHPTQQLGLAVDWARGHGAARVTLVGASMGGSIVIGSAAALQADAMVDLSGPPEWQGVPSALEAAPHLRMPVLVAAAPHDPSTDAAVLRQAVRRAPAAQKRFVSAKDGHGWELLREGSPYAPGPVTWTPFAAVVADWITGEATAAP